MSDDLTERLREWWDYDHGRLIEQALDRIEELDAKLEMAVDAFTRIDDLTCHNMPMTARDEQAVNREARATLIALKGQDDD